MSFQPRSESQEHQENFSGKMYHPAGVEALLSSQEETEKIVFVKYITTSWLFTCDSAMGLTKSDSLSARCIK